MDEGASSQPELNVRHEVTVGTSFAQGAPRTMHTMRYNFKPTSAEWKRRGRLRIRDKSAKVLMPVVGSKQQMTFSGNVEQHRPSECLLIRDNDGKWRIERLGMNIKNLKQERESVANERWQTAAAVRAALSAAEMAGNEDE